MNWFSAINKQAPSVDLDQLPETFTCDWSHVIITKSGIFKGVMQAEDFNLLDLTELKSQFSLYSEYFCGHYQQTILDVFSLFLKHQTNLLPIINQEEELIGSLELDQVLDLLTETDFISQESDSILIKKATKDFSYSEITQLLERINAQILGMFTTEVNQDTIEVLVKLKHYSLNEILQTLRRYGYEIMSHHEDDVYKDSLKDRSNYLNKYLNI